MIKLLVSFGSGNMGRNMAATLVNKAIVLFIGDDLFWKRQRNNRLNKVINVISTTYLILRNQCSGHYFYLYLKQNMVEAYCLKTRTALVTALPSATPLLIQQRSVLKQVQGAKNWPNIDIAF